MSNLLYARSLMGLSLAFHIVFAAIGIGLPMLMVLAQWRWRRTGNVAYRDLAKHFAKGTAVLFAIGAVSGTVISFELGLLWPRFMHFSGAIIGFPFSLEGFAFFTEAIFLGLYLYGEGRIAPRFHFACGAIVALSGAASAFFVTLANAWMNNPVGFDVVDGMPVNIDPVVAMFAPGWWQEVLHVILSCYAATGLLVAGIHAFYLRQHPKSALHRAAVGIALSVGGVAAMLLPLSGDVSARHVARAQPVKLAALEGQFKTERGAPLRVLGLPDVDTRTTPYAIELPRGLSLLAFHDLDAEVRGLNDFPRTDWPHVPLVHAAFQVMVGAGGAIALISIIGLWLAWRGGWRVPTDARFLRALTLISPLGFVALQAGWMVTELGRQPFVIAGIMRVDDAVTPVPNLAVPFWMFVGVYVFLSLMVVTIIGRQIRNANRVEVQA